MTKTRRPGPDDARVDGHEDGSAPTAEHAPAVERHRPVVERVGMAAIAIVMAALFLVVAAAAFAGGEPFLGVMGLCGCLMVLWVGGISVLRS